MSEQGTGSNDDGFGNVEAPGWRALDAWSSSLYPGQTPHQFTSPSPYELDAPNPLPAITVWESGAPSSYHFVTYGLSELFEKTSRDPDISGFGFELTLRVPRQDSDERPPAWALTVLQALGHHVLRSGKGFDTGHCIGLGGPVVPPSRLGFETAIVGFAAIPDPILRKLDGPFGSVLFLQLVGLTESELTDFADWDAARTLDALGDLDSAGVTDLRRSNWADDPQKAKVLRRHRVGLKL